MRGKGGRTGSSGRYTGITPAYAGKRRVWFSSWPVPWDHPRACGEKLRRLRSSQPPPGSPPRMRGKAVFPARQHRTTGITPACAGKSRSHQKRTAWEGDHPRVCGEKKVMNLVLVRPLGSPPRMRGKGDGVPCADWQRGITPACAGKRGIPHAPEVPKRDHPRVCGEKGLCNRPSGHKAGSPPRMRGKGHGLQHIAPDAGITPACAGKSCST